jgi:hypothetical protein
MVAKWVCISPHPTADIVARVRGAAVADLERWALRVLDARALGDVFTP